MHLNIALCWAVVQPAAGEQVVRGGGKKVRL